MSKRSLRVFSREFKQRTVLRLEKGERVAAVAEEAGVKPQLLYDWRAAYRAMGVAGLSRKRGRKPGWRRNQASASSSAWSAGSRWICIFFREALRLWDATSHDSGAPTSTRSSKK